jgi:hypothetical protein
MTPDTVVQLGAFAFASFEVPTRIRWGASQRLSIKERIGGKRRIDAMGASFRPLDWSGMFTGQDAASRAQYLESLAVSGAVQDFSWAQFKYKVVVRDFDADYERFYRVPYHIVCEVASNQTKPVTQAPTPAIDAVLQDSFNQAAGLGGLIGDDTLNSLLGGLDTAISAVSSFANAAQSTINSVLLPLSAVQDRVSTLLTASSLTIQNVSTFGGVLPSTPFSQAPLGLLGQMSAMEQSSNLVQLRGICGSMGANLVSISNPPTKVATAGGNLFQIAQDQYGDPMAWTAIARANGLTNPFISGTANLAIPKKPDTAGGVLRF